MAATQPHALTRPRPSAGVQLAITSHAPPWFGRLAQHRACQHTCVVVHLHALLSGQRAEAVEGKLHIPVQGRQGQGRQGQGRLFDMLGKGGGILEGSAPAVTQCGCACVTCSNMRQLLCAA